jgi:hypothetical protein
MAEYRAIADLLASADAMLVTDRFMAGWTPIPPPPEPTRLERLFLAWCPPILVPQRLAAKVAAWEDWESGEAPRWRPPPMPPIPRGTVIRWRRPFGGSDG